MGRGPGGFFSLYQKADKKATEKACFISEKQI